jgi:acyl carrier protein
MTDQLRRLLAELVAEASDGEIRSEDVLAAAVPLPAIGVTSLTQIRLIDAIEDRWGIEVDADPSVVNDLDALAGYLTARGVTP